MNKIVCFFLSAVLGGALIGMIPLIAGVTASSAASWTLAPTNPEYIDYLADLTAGKKVSPIMPPRVDVRALADLRQLPPGPPPPPPPPPGNQGFPSAYDLRTLGRVTPARLAKCGACWTTATYGSLESFLTPAEIWDFSEDHLQLEIAFDYPACGSGAHAGVSTNYLSAWRGPVNEHDYNYKSEAAQNPLVQKHVQKVFYLPERQTPLDNDWLKLAVMFYGGVYSSASFGFGLNPTNYTYYNPVANSVHAVTIVGWDDNFDKSKFFYDHPAATDDQKIPPGNGAFICKNNWGPGWMEKGFYYVSYYDAAIASGMAVFTAEPASNYNRIYQYDPLGVTDHLIGNTLDLPTLAANVFTAAAADNLIAVSFFNLEPTVPVDYQIRIYLDPPADTPVSPVTGPAATVNVSLALPGYYTVKLPHKVPLQKGQRFSVVLSGFWKQDSHGFGAWVAIERPGIGYSQATANPGESYVSLTGEAWQDVTTVLAANPDNGNALEPLTNTNVCIKAFTTPKLSIGAWKPEGLVKYLAWSLTNDNDTATSVKPVAQLYRKTKSGFAKFGGEVDAAYYLDGRGVEHKAKGGWVEVRPGETVTAYSKRRALDKADRAAYNYYTDHPADNHKGRIIRLSDVWKYLPFESPLHVVSTSPMSNENVNSPLSIITVNFDKEIKTGPSLQNISVMSSGVPSETKMTYNSVGGNTLYIALTSPIYISQDPGSGEILWQVHLPGDAVTDLSGNPLGQDYSWSFTSGLAR
jgi:C1A family cysteine protease